MNEKSAFYVGAVPTTLVFHAPPGAAYRVQNIGPISMNVVFGDASNSISLLPGASVDGTPISVSTSITVNCIGVGLAVGTIQRIS